MENAIMYQKGYILTSINCAWMAIEVLKHGKLSSSVYKKLDNMQWNYIKSRRESNYIRQMKTIIPSLALNQIENIFGTSIKTIKGV